VRHNRPCQTISFNSLFAPDIPRPYQCHPTIICQSNSAILSSVRTDTILYDDHQQLAGQTDRRGSRSIVILVVRKYHNKQYIIHYTRHPPCIPTINDNIILQINPFTRRHPSIPSYIRNNNNNNSSRRRKYKEFDNIS